MSNETSDAYLYFSSLAYDTPENRQQSLDQSASLNHYVIDPYFNEAEHFAAYNVEDGSIIIGHRGTASLSDVQTDIGLAFGSLESTDRYQRSFDFSRRVHEKYSSNSITQVGHSLGGTLADSISRRMDDQSVVFNRGSSPFEAHKPVNAKHQHHRTSEDFISSFGQASSVKQTHSSKFGHRLQEARSRFGSWGFLVPNPTANRTYSAYTGHLLSNFF